MGFIKPRTQERRSFGGNVNSTKQAAQRGNFKNPEGQYDSWYPNLEKAIWWAMCPDQKWNFEMYSREAGVVEANEGFFYLGYVNHRVAVNSRNFQCSAGAHKDKPCWGCTVRRDFWDRQNAKEEATGVKPSGKAPISEIPQFAIASVVLEHVAKIQPWDKKTNKPKVNKRGEPIMKETPLTLLDDVQAKRLKAEGATTFGMRAHWSCGIIHLNTLSDFDKELANYCANCAKQMTCTAFACPKCATPLETLDDEGQPLQGQSLHEKRQEELRCSCGFRGKPSATGPEDKWEPLLNCVCGNPEEGQLTDFALRLITVKTSETQRVLKYTAVRTLKHYTDKYPAVVEMLAKPLPLDEIFAPTSIEMQRFCVPESLRNGLSPAPRPMKGAAEEGEPAQEYPLGGDPDDADDDD